jgi:hypothetical protein
MPPTVRMPGSSRMTMTASFAQGPGVGGYGGLVGVVKKTRGDRPQGLGRMIGLEDRRIMAQNIRMAHAAGARLRLACETADIQVRTLQRWKAHDGLTTGDGRPPRPCQFYSGGSKASLQTRTSAYPCRRREQSRPGRLRLSVPWCKGSVSLHGSSLETKGEWAPSA